MQLDNYCSVCEKEIDIGSEGALCHWCGEVICDKHVRYADDFAMSDTLCEDCYEVHVTRANSTDDEEFDFETELDDEDEQGDI